MYFHLLMSSLGTSLVSLPALLGTALPLASVRPNSNPIVYSLYASGPNTGKDLGLCGSIPTAPYTFARFNCASGSMLVSAMFSKRNEK